MFVFTQEMSVMTTSGPRVFKKGERPEGLRSDVLKDLERMGVVAEQEAAEPKEEKKPARKMLKGGYENKAKAVKESK